MSLRAFESTAKHSGFSIQERSTTVLLFTYLQNLIPDLSKFGSACVPRSAPLSRTLRQLPHAAIRDRRRLPARLLTCKAGSRLFDSNAPGRPLTWRCMKCRAPLDQPTEMQFRYRLRRIRVAGRFLPEATTVMLGMVLSKASSAQPDDHENQA